MVNRKKELEKFEAMEGGPEKISYALIMIRFIEREKMLENNL